jgi:hypothetical protein
MIFEKLRKRDNPYGMCSYFIIKKEVEHQGLGGKKAYLQFKVPIKEIIEKAEEGNWACGNFVDRRRDLFELKTDPLFNPEFSGDHIAYIGPHDMIFYYVKAFTSPEHLNGASDWLGYVIANDEIKSKHLKEDDV